MAMGDYFHRTDILESMMVWVPFRSFERCVSVFNNTFLEWQIANAFKLIDTQIEVKHRWAHHRLWYGYENNLRFYIWHMQKELQRRGHEYRYYPFITDWKTPRYTPWEHDKLFYISQKVLLMRKGLRWYIGDFYVATHREWPEGGYYPVEGITERQQIVNEKWRRCFKDKFHSRTKNVKIYVNVEKDLIDDWEKIGSVKEQRKKAKKKPSVVLKEVLDHNPRYPRPRYTGEMSHNPKYPRPRRRKRCFTAPEPIAD